MFFETKYGKIISQVANPICKLGMFFETKYGKIGPGWWQGSVRVRDVL